MTETSATEPLRPRLLLMAPYFAPACNGGAPRLFDTLLSRVRAFDVVVLANSLDASDADNAAYDRAALEERGYRVLRKPIPGLQFAPGTHALGKMWPSLQFLRWRLRLLRACVASERVDIVVAGDSFTCGWLWNRLPASLLRVNYIHGEEMTMQMEFGPLSRWQRRQQLASLRNADLDIAVSRYSADQVVRLAGADAAKVVVLPNAVDIGKFEPPIDRNALRDRLDWSGRTVLLTVARLIPRKGIDQVLRALKQARELPDDWLYVIAGRGVMEPQLRALVTELGLGERVKFSGFLPEEDLAACYGAADVFIQPNRCIDGDTEGFGIVFLEASACGTPVIGGTAGGTGDAIEDEVSGLRVDGDSVEEVTIAIERLMGDAALRSRMAADGLERVRRDFTADPFARRFEDFVLDAWRRKQWAVR